MSAMHISRWFSPLAAAALVLAGVCGPSQAQEFPLAPPVKEKEPAREPAAAATAEAIPVAEMEKIRARLGQHAVATGEVANVTTAASGYKRVTFKGSKFILYVGKNDAAAHPDWNLEQWKGKTVFASGLVKEYRSTLEIVLKAPAHIAATLEALDLSSAETSRSPARSASAQPGASEAAPKRTQARIAQLTARVQDVLQPFLAYERFHAELANGYRTSPLVLPDYTGRERALAAADAEMARARRPWPQGSHLRVANGSGAGATPGKGLPRAFAIALAMESMLDDFDLPPELAVAGQLAPEGALTGGLDELMLLDKPPPPASAILLVPASAAPALNDLALDDAWACFISRPIFSARTLADATRIARALGSGEWNGPLAQFQETAALLEKDPSPALRSSSVRARLEAIAQACPDLLTARVLLAFATSSQPPRYSPAASGLKLRLFYAKIERESKGMSMSKADESKKKLRELKSELRGLAGKCPPESEAFHETLKDWLDALDDSLKFSRRDESSRAKKAFSEVTRLAALSKTKSDEAALPKP